jgi:hypothetical protein
MPMQSVDIRFKVLELLYADTYGETYRIMIGKKRSGIMHDEMGSCNGSNKSKGNEQGSE